MYENSKVKIIYNEVNFLDATLKRAGIKYLNLKYSIQCFAVKLKQIYFVLLFSSLAYVRPHTN